MIQILAQGEEAAQEEKTTVNLASPRVLPGERAYLTLLLANASDVSVTQLDHWIEFPNSKLAYVSSRLGIAADLAKAVLEVEVQDKPASETGRGGDRTAALVDEERAAPSRWASRGSHFPCGMSSPRPSPSPIGWKLSIQKERKSQILFLPMVSWRSQINCRTHRQAFSAASFTCIST